MERHKKGNCNRKLSDEQVLLAHERHIKQYVPIVQLAKEAGLTRQNLRKRFVALGLPYQRRFVRSADTNHRFFDKIDTELKAYLLGFIAGDGSVSKGKPYLNLQIQEGDIEVLEYAKTIAPHVQLIRTKPRSSRHKSLVKLSVYSQPMIEDLARHGIVPLKSFKPFRLMEFNTRMWRHIIRGFLDADGCVHKRKDYGQQVFFSSTSRPFLEQIQRVLTEHLIESTLVQVQSKSTAIYCLRIMKMDSIKKMYKLLYHNTQFYLSRKYEKFKSLITPS